MTRLSKFLCLILATTFVLAGCQETHETDEARTALKQAEVLFTQGVTLEAYPTCDSQYMALEKFDQAEELAYQASQMLADSDILRSAAKMTRQADDRFHEVIKTNYAAECCWAQDLMIKCAEARRDKLDTNQLTRLNEITQKYERTCRYYSKASTQLAWLTL